MSVRELVRNKKYQIELPLSYKGNNKKRHFETFFGGKKDALLREAKLKMQSSVFLFFFRFPLYLSLFHLLITYIIPLLDYFLLSLNLLIILG